MSTPGTSLYVNADWSALVPMESIEAAFGITVEEAKRRGLLPLGEGEHFADPEVLTSIIPAPVPVAEPEPTPEPEPEAKEAAKPANKAAVKPANKRQPTPRHEDTLR